MSDRYPGGLITKTPVTPAGPYAEGSASGVWTLDQAMQYTKQGIWPQASNPAPNDPYFQYVTSLLHGDGTNGGQNNTFLDSSTNAFTITRNGNTTQGSFSPYGSNWGNYFPRDGAGTNRQYLYTGSNVSGISGDFTIECWANFDDVTTDNVLFGLGDANSTGFFVRVEYVGATGPNTLNFYAAGDHYVNFPSVLQNGGWNHIAVTRQSNTLKVWLNGVQQSTTHSLSTSFSSDVFYIGAGKLGATVPYNPNKGYMSNVRLVNGTAVYTSNFTPSTTPLTAITNTAVLTCQSNRFVDNSSNNYSIVSATGTSATVQVTRFSPFAPTYATQYSASTIGGSGYFDGSGDYLTVADNAALELGTSDFTLECWFYATAQGSNLGLIAKGWHAGVYGSYVISYNDGALVFDASSTNSSWDMFSEISITNTLVKNQWNHIAVTREGSTFRFYLNGVRTNTGTSSASFYNGTGVLAIGAGDNGQGGVTGYVSDVRLVKGTALYTGSTYTIPTSPLTAVSNTSLLTNMTNGAIYDNAMIPDYETVGNAQISTSVKKYGTGSLAFDGTGDYLITPSQSTTTLSGNFTIEGWYYRATSGNNYFFTVGDSSLSTGLEVYIGSSGTVLNLYTGGSAIITSSVLPPVTTWTHLAVSRVGSTIKLFVNGTQVGSATASTTYSGAIYVGAEYYGGSITGSLNGNIDDFRITKGYARYWENFTPPAAALPNFGGAYQVPTQDPQFNYTTLLLPGNGTNGAQNNTFLDSSTNAFTITRNGNTTQGTFTPFSQTGWGNYFNGSSRLLPPVNSAFSFGTGDFTVEFWFYPNSTDYAALFAIGDGYGTSTGLGINCFADSGGGNTTKCRIDIGGSVVAFSGVPTINQWNHIAVTRSGTSVKFFINGTSIGSTTSSANITSGDVVVGGSSTAYNIYMPSGYLSNFRVNKGTALYTANFTPSTTPLTAVSGTSLLTCQSNRFVDNSSNAFAITVGGAPQVQAFSPFAPTAAYSASTVGGSGYFDGNGDSLSTTSLSSSITGDFTVEGFVYLTEAFSAVTHTIFGPWNTPANNFLFRISTGGALQLYMAGSLVFSSAATFKPNEWVHLAISRSSGTLKCFVNGVEFFSGSNSSTVNLSTFIVGAETTSSTTSDIWKGYISNVRVSQTTARYTAAFTPPTAPFTNDASTTLLLSCTNAGITDATAKNDLETVSNAQISTTQSKFGGSSMYFDGTGDYLPTAASQSFNFGYGDFTIECWAYFNDTASKAIISQNDSAANNVSISLYTQASGFLRAEVAVGASIKRITSSVAFSTNQWYHIAYVRYGETLTLYINGVSVGTYALGAVAVDYSSYQMTVGRLGQYDGYYFNGYMQDVRITKGYARYVQPFTPPAQADQLY